MQNSDQNSCNLCSSITYSVFSSSILFHLRGHDISSELLLLSMHGIYSIGVSIASTPLSYHVVINSTISISYVLPAYPSIDWLNQSYYIICNDCISSEPSVLPIIIIWGHIMCLVFSGHLTTFFSCHLARYLPTIILDDMNIISHHHLFIIAGRILPPFFFLGWPSTLSISLWYLLHFCQASPTIAIISSTSHK